MTRHGPPSRTIRVQRTPGATAAPARRSSSEREPSGSSAALAGGTTASATAVPSADAQTLQRKTGAAYSAFSIAASSSLALNAPSMRAATRPPASTVNTHGSLGRLKALTWER